MVNERRKERRIRARLPIRINRADNPPIYIQTENISLLGTYVELENELTLGEKLDITVEIPAYTNNVSLTGDIRCRGDVFRSKLVTGAGLRKVYGLGIFFADFYTEQDRNKLSEYIDFLIHKEQQDVKQAMLRWRKKRRKRSAQKRISGD